MKVKVCGMRNLENILEVNTLPIDYIGFIFYQKSPRWIGQNKLFSIPKRLKAKKVGVFVNESIENIAKNVNEYHLDAIQLHGDETPQFINSLRVVLGPTQIIKALRIQTKEDILQANSFQLNADLLILDTKSSAYGGTGKQWNHSLLKGVEIKIPFLISGGIDTTFDYSNLTELHSNCIGIDLNSGFETEPALKDIDKLKSFLS